MNVLVGADPEVFAKRDGKYVSAHGMVQGDKLNPLPVRNGAVQVDGMALEFNIDPTGEEEQFVHNINDVLAQLRAMVPDVEVVADPVAHFSTDYMEEQPEEALILGCDPDFNAWSGAENTPPDNKKPMRTAAGHVHIGWTDEASGEEHLGMCTALVKQLDFYLGLPSLLFDNDNERREMYGKAGAYRPKSYGVEYRVLSNRWLATDNLMRWVHRATTNCVASMTGQQLADKYGDIQHIINNSDTGAARDIIQAEGLLVPAAV